MAHKPPSAEVSKQLAHDLGALFLNFGVLEHTLSRAVAAATGLSQTQEGIFVRGMFARAKVQLLQSYAKKHWKEKRRRELDTLAKKVLELVDYRNGFAHGTILHDLNGVWNLISFSGGDRFSGRAEPIDLELLRQRLNEAMDYAEAFDQLARHLEHDTD